ncbi:MAG: ACP S-malonyltransferase [Clostridia bacterium]|nr:ACP S-malonyltransferase [Clostridia bacterium]
MKKTAFVFSGQGAQYPGMGKELYECSPAAKAVFDMAEEIRPGTLKQCFESTKEELSITINTQPCVFITDLAAAAAVAEKGIKPEFVAGFSLGEIAAIAFAGILSYEEAFKLVCKRAELMDKAANENPGAMAAVMKITPEKTEEICSKFNKAYPVNYNSPAQTVVAADVSEIDELCGMVKAEKGKAVKLAVSGAFHSPFMDSASEAMAEYLADKELKEPSVPVYANLTAEPYSDDFKKLISMQINHPVRWQKTVENMIAQGAERFIEVGVGKTLTGLIKKINADVEAVNIENKEGLDTLE